MYAMKYPEKKEAEPIRSKKLEEENVVQTENMVRPNRSVLFKSDGQSGSHVCQLARGEQQGDGSWKTFSSFKSKMEINENEWVVTCYRTQTVPAHRMLALEGHDGTMGWERAEHLQIPEMARSNQMENILKMALNGMRLYSMKCRPDWRTDLLEKARVGREMPHEHVSLRISQGDGEKLRDKMESEINREYDYSVTGGDRENSFNCKTWVQYMHPQFGDNI